MTDLRSKIREVPDFPTPGVGFKDITPLLADREALHATINGLASWAREKKPDVILGAEARGFILGAAIAAAVDCGFVPARRPGKLPHETVSAEYALEYGINTLEVHADALSGGTRVLVHDDLLATGGTAGALCELVEGMGAEVAGCGFLIELSFLEGRKRLAPRTVFALIDFDY